MHGMNISDVTRQGGRRTVGYVRANLISVGILVTAVGLVLAGHGIMWGLAAGEVLDTMFESNGLLLALALAVLAHELLHMIGFRFFGDVPWCAMRMGVHWRTLTPFATARVAVTASSYRWTAALPGFALGAVPMVAGILLNAPLVSGFGIVMLAAAGGDAAILWALRREPAAALVLDCPDAMGCLVFATGEDSARTR